MPYNSKIGAMLAMMAAYHELKHAVDTGKTSSTAGVALVMLEREIDWQTKEDERFLRWMDASQESRERMRKAHRRTT